MRWRSTALVGALFIALCGCTGGEDSAEDMNAVSGDDDLGASPSSVDPPPPGSGPGVDSEPEPIAPATPEGPGDDGPPAPTPEPEPEPEPDDGPPFGNPTPTRPPSPFDPPGPFGSGGDEGAPSSGGSPAGGGEGGEVGLGGDTSRAGTSSGGMAGQMSGEGGSGDCAPDYDCDPEAPDTGDYHADCVARVNQFRACVCLPALARNYEAEACMDEQAEYDSELDQAHAGFSDGVCMPRGNSQNECPGWGNATQAVEGCIQQMFYEGPPSEDPCEGQCYQDHGHFINMTDADVTSVACGMFDGDNGFWAVQNFFR